jgi:hypothetical protein
MAFKEICNGYRLTVQRSLRYPPSISIRKWYQPDDKDEKRAGLPGIELSISQFNQLEKMLVDLNDFARCNKSAQCLLGGNRLVEVCKGRTVLRRVPTSLEPLVPSRHELTFKAQLWREFWQHREWMKQQLNEASIDTQPMPLEEAEEETESEEEEEEEEFSEEDWEYHPTKRQMPSCNELKNKKNKKKRVV